MAITNISRRTLAGLLAGATAARAIVAEHSEEEIPKDVIQQWEIACLYHLEATKDMLALAFKKRIEAGATIEAGPYVLDPDPAEASEEMESDGMGPHGFNMPGFYAVDFNEPDDAPEASAT